MVRDSQYIIISINKFHTQTEPFLKISSIVRKSNIFPSFRENKNTRRDITLFKFNLHFSCVIQNFFHILQSIDCQYGKMKRGITAI